MLGAEVSPQGVRFSVWAETCRSVSVRIAGQAGGDVPLAAGTDGVFSTFVPGVMSGARYFYVLDGNRARPDPRSRFQPDGVHGPSQVMDPNYPWRSRTPVRGLDDHVLYELHVGTFTREGTFSAARDKLPLLAELGITAIEVMPVAAFPGARNWGYDGVHLFAPNAAYGTPDELRALVDFGHELGLSMVLDVVYNHLGPEGNYLSEFSRYFTDENQTLWGPALDFRRQQVRRWILDNARSWLHEYRFDGLRVDAVHAIVDDSSTHLLAEMCQSLKSERECVLIAETDINQAKIFEQWGFDACWSDDFHHALHVCLTGERTGYYREFGGIRSLAHAIADGWVRGPHPGRSQTFGATQFVVASQTHDQVGNRAFGERLEHLVSRSESRLAAIALLAATPAVPMIFQGQEFASSSPFLYFTSHGDPDLGRAVAEGRRREFSDQGFLWPNAIPHPQDEETFFRSKLDWSERERPGHVEMLRLYRDLLALRRANPPLSARDKDRCRVEVRGDVLWIFRGNEHLIVLNLSVESVEVGGEWRLLLHSEAVRYGGNVTESGQHLPGLAAAVYRQRSGG